MDAGLWRGPVAVAAVVIIALAVYGLREFSSPLLYGIDGPYYQVQVASILRSGSMLYDDPPLAFYTLAGFSILLGDVVSGIKVGSLLITLLGAFAIYYLVRETSGEMGGMTAAVIYAFNPWMARMIMELMKNAMGLTFLSLTLLFALLSIRRGDLRLSTLSSVFMVLTGLTHILDFGVALAILLLMALLHREDRRSLRLLSLPILAALALLWLGFTTDLMGGDPYKGVALLQEMTGGSGGAGVRHARGVNPMVLDALPPLLVAISGLILSLGLGSTSSGRDLLIPSSAVLLALSFPLNPGNFLWRFVLMTAVLAPIIVGSALGRVGDPRVASALFLIVMGLLLPLTISKVNAARPSIPVEEYWELRDLVQGLRDGHTLVVPSPRLLYWVQTLDPGAVRSPREGSGAMVLIVKRQTSRPPFLRGRPLYRGRFVEAFLLDGGG